MLQVVVAGFFRLGVIFSVVVAIGKSQAALIYVGDFMLGVVGILRRAGREEQGSWCRSTVEGKLQVRHEGSEVLVDFTFAIASSLD